MDGWEQIYSDIEDRLVPGLGLSVWERALYYHLLRHTRLKSLPSGMFPLVPLSKAVGISEPKVRDVLRALHRKGCVKIEERSREGHLVAVLFPSEMTGLPEPPNESLVIDIEEIDFFTGRRYVEALLNRESGACTYCLKKLSRETAELDHLIPQVVELENSYRNVVVACHGCNKAKGVLPASDFVRRLYREGVLNETELKARLARIEAIQAGEVVPEIERAG
jgi:5-methylcytosine-specific restriction endonuclease McrA